MKRILLFILSVLLLVPSLGSCGSENPAGTLSPEEDSSRKGEDTRNPEPVTEAPETDPFEGAEPLPADLVIPEAVKTGDGTVIGTIVLPAGADVNETTAAEELRYHIQKVTGAELPIVGRPGENYGSLIVCSPASLPALSELFPDDLAWLADLGSAEEGRWGEDGFAIRTLGKDIYIFGGVTRGTLNGAYDWIEENLGVLWVFADEELGLIYNDQPEVTVLKTDYREKSPFSLRGWSHQGNAANGILWSRSKLNFNGRNPSFVLTDPGVFNWDIKQRVRTSPLYDPEETEYWNTDEAGNRMADADSPQVNLFSRKTEEAVAASCIEDLKAGRVTFAFIAEMDNILPVYCRPEDTQPYEYAPGEFVNPEDEDYLSTVFFSFLNHIARRVKEEVPDGKIAAFAYILGMVPPRCEIEDNIYIWFAPIYEDMTLPLMSGEISEKADNNEWKKHLHDYPEYLTAFAEKTGHIQMYNYYGCSKAVNRVTRPIWDRIQTDFQDYVRMGLEGVSSEGIADDLSGANGEWGAYQDGWKHNGWIMNGMLFWIYSKLAWNPWEDVGELIRYYCDRVYGDASEAMQTYYALMKQGWEAGASSTNRPVGHDDDYIQYYKTFVKNTGIGHDLIDALNAAYDAATGNAQTIIGYMRDTVVTTMSQFRSY